MLSTLSGFTTKRARGHPDSSERGLMEGRAKITDAPEHLRAILRDRTLTPAEKRDMILRREKLSHSQIAREAESHLGDKISRQAVGGVIAGSSRSARIEQFIAERVRVPESLLFPEPRQRSPRQGHNGGHPRDN